MAIVAFEALGHLPEVRRIISHCINLILRLPLHLCVFFTSLSPGVQVGVDKLHMQGYKRQLATKTIWGLTMSEVYMHTAIVTIARLTACPRIYLGFSLVAYKNGAIRPCGDKIGSEIRGPG